MTDLALTSERRPGLAIDLWWLPRGLALGLLAFIIFGPLANLVLWAFAERWYFPHALPLDYGVSFWAKVFSPRGNAIESLSNSIVVALLTVVLSLSLAVPPAMRWRG